MALSKAGGGGEKGGSGGLVRAPRRCVRACVCIRDVMRCATRRRCARIVNVMLMVLMGSRCHTSGMRIQSHAGVTLLPVYMPRVRTLQSDHLQSLTSVNHQPLAPIHFLPLSSSLFSFLLLIDLSLHSPETIEFMGPLNGGVS